ncbi:MAG: HEAT repeat domain-containing protein [Cytophagales bacterium]|nr:HEAT repeat domain-containing protein [Cytophagales bacterium]
MKHEELDIDLKEFPERIKKLVLLLNDSNGLTRESGRAKFVAMDGEAITYLEHLLITNQDTLRWEAVKALEEIADKSSIPVFLRLMERDPSGDIRELAAKGLARFGHLGLVPLLEELIKRDPIEWIYETASLVLRRLSKQDHEKYPAIKPLTDALLSDDRTGVRIRPLAEKVLEEIEEKPL